MNQNKILSYSVRWTQTYDSWTVEDAEMDLAEARAVLARIMAL